MKKMLQNIFYGKSTLMNGLIALTILGLIVLGCTCNGEKFDFGSKSDTNSSKEKDPVETPKKKEITKSDASEGELPEDDELEAIIKKSLLDFGKAIKDEDFTDFYESTSKPFQRSISPRRLKKKFKTFIDMNADLSVIESVEPDYSSPPKVKKDRGIYFLEAKGRFDSDPKPWRFDLKYIPEGEDWKLISIGVYTRK